MAYPRIIYNSITVDFSSGLSGFDPVPVSAQQVTISRSGKRATTNFFQQWDIPINVVNVNADLIHQLEAFYDYVRTGNSFSFYHDPDLKGYWNFENRGLNSNDEIAPLTTSGTMAYPAGKFGAGLNITNQTVYYNADTFFADPPPKGTIAFWFAPNFVVSSNAVNHTLFQIDSASGDPVSGAFWTSGNYFLWGVNAAASSPIAIQSSVSSYLQNVFHHFCVTWDSTISNGGKMYLDGVLVATSTNSSFTVKSTGTNFRVGYNGTDYANGIFDEIIVRADVMSAEDIAELGSGRTAYWIRRNYWASLYYEGGFDPQRQLGTPYYNLGMQFKEIL